MRQFPCIFASFLESCSHNFLDLMHLSRFTALETIIKRSEEAIDYQDPPSTRIASYFGCNVFGEKAMEEYLPQDIYLQLKDAIRAGKKLSRSLADDVAIGMQKWAMDKGATRSEERRVGKRRS